MAACGTLQDIFEKPLPENPTLLESLSQWKNQIKPVKALEQPSYTEIFGELHFKDTSSCSPSSSSLPLSSFSTTSSPFVDLNTQSVSANVKKGESDSLDNKCESKKRRSIFDSFSSNNQYTASSHKSSDGYSPRNLESLQLCTEGLGFESSDDVEDMKSDIEKDWQYHEEKVSTMKHSVPENATAEFRRSRSSGREFPPPISCIGKSGKPWVYFKSYRHDGRFVLKEVRIPTFEFLHACREDGRLKLHFVHPNEETFDEEEEEEENHTEYDEQEETEAKGNNNRSNKI